MRLACTMSDPHNPNNFPVYIADQDLGNCILSFGDGIDSCTEETYIDEKESENMHSTGI